PAPARSPPSSIKNQNRKSKIPSRPPLEHNSRIAPSLTKLAVRQRIQTRKRITHDHPGVRELQHGHVMVHHETEFDDRQREPGLPQIRKVLESAVLGGQSRP